MPLSPRGVPATAPAGSPEADEQRVPAAGVADTAAAAAPSAPCPTPGAESVRAARGWPPLTTKVLARRRANRYSDQA